jgi:beta-lactamase superfamily II metal-dependent hydrolase
MGMGMRASFVGPKRRRPGGVTPREGRTHRSFRLFFLLSVLFAAWPTAARAQVFDDELTIVQVAVRQGDAAVFRGPCGELGVIDTNRHRSAEVLQVLDEMGSRTLEWVSVSHYDADHLGGILDVATAPGVSVERAFDRGGGRDAHDTATYRAYFDWVTSGATDRQPLDVGDEFSLCSGDEEVVFNVVSAGTDGTAASDLAVKEENDKGLCLRITFRQFAGATCGDVNGTDEGDRANVESAVAAAIGPVHFLKVNHHGSRFSSSQGFVDTLAPLISVVSTGRNPFGHPDEAVLARWRIHGDVYVTQDSNNEPVDGNVSVTTSGTSLLTVTTSTSDITRTYSLDPDLRCPGLEDVPGTHLVGSVGDDTIAGGQGADVICGGEGDDTLLGADGDDLLLGDAGNDSLFGASGGDEIVGGSGSDVLDGGVGDNICDAGAADSLRFCATDLSVASSVAMPDEGAGGGGGGMFGSEILEVAIGLILVFLVLSLVVAATNEVVAAFLKQRAKFLREGIDRILGKELREKLYAHPLLNGLKPGDKDPAYVPDDIFSLALLDLVLPDGLDQKRASAEVRRRLEEIPHEGLRTSLDLLLRESRDDLVSFRKGIEKWFNDSMDRVSGWYKRNARLSSLVIGAILVVIFNADTLQIARALWNDDALRSAVVSQAESTVEESPPADPGGADGSPDPGERLDAVAKSIDDVQELQLPLGWSMQPGDPRWVRGGDFWGLFASWFGKVLGLVVTAAAISLGAPFWFDLLSRLVPLRTAGPVRGGSSDAKARDDDELDNE